MTKADHRRTPARQQTPDSIRDTAFGRRPLGLDPGRVYEYLDELADQLAELQRDIEAERGENRRLGAELERVQAQLDDYEQIGDRVNEQVVELFSHAQLVAEEMVKDVSRDARERIGQARAQERKIVAEALATAGQQVRRYAQTAQAQMQSVVDSFAGEVDRLGSPPVSSAGDEEPVQP